MSCRKCGVQNRRKRRRSQDESNIRPKIAVKWKHQNEKLEQMNFSSHETIPSLPASAYLGINTTEKERNLFWVCPFFFTPLHLGWKLFLRLSFGRFAVRTWTILSFCGFAGFFFGILVFGSSLALCLLLRPGMGQNEICPISFNSSKKVKREYCRSCARRNSWVCETVFHCVAPNKQGCFFDHVWHGYSPSQSPVGRKIISPPVIWCLWISTHEVECPGERKTFLLSLDDFSKWATMFQKWMAVWL